MNAGAALGLIAAQVEGLEAHRFGGIDPLEETLWPRFVPRPQNVVSLEQVAHRLLERRHIERPLVLENDGQHLGHGEACGGLGREPPAVLVKRRLEPLAGGPQ